MSLLTRPLRLLTADGALATLALAEPRLGAPTVLVARELCRFEHFAPPPGLTGRAAVAATRLRARTRAPFAAPGMAIVRRGDGFGVWWWDGARVAAALAAAGAEPGVRLLPEPLYEPAGDGARVVRARGGFEAQLWVRGGLLARRLREAGFDPAAWSAFVRGAGGDPASPPPTPMPLPLTIGSGYGRGRLRELDAEGAGATALVGLAALTLTASAFFAGQGASAAQRDAALRQAIATREAQGAKSRRPALAAQARRLEAVAQLVDRPDPLTRVLAAQRVLDRFGVKATGFQAGPREVSLTVPSTAVAGVDLLVEALQASPDFAEVRPELDRQARRLTLHMVVRGAEAPRTGG